MTRLARAAALALLSVAVLSGCIRYDVDVTVSSDNTASGTMVIAVQKGVGEQLGVGSDEEALGQLFGEQDLGENFTEKDYAEDDWIGKTYTFEDQKLDELTAFSDLFTITRDGDTFTLQGTDAPTTAEEAGQVPAGGEATLSVTFPGKVSSSNGTVDGNTVTWDLFTTTEPLEATASATSGPNIKLYAAIAGAVVLALALGAIAFIVIRRMRSGAAAAPVESVDAPGSTGEILPEPHVPAAPAEAPASANEFVALPDPEAPAATPEGDAKE